MIARCPPIDDGALFIRVLGLRPQPTACRDAAARLPRRRPLRIINTKPRRKQPCYLLNPRRISVVVFIRWFLPLPDAAIARHTNCATAIRSAGKHPCTHNPTRSLARAQVSALLEPFRIPGTPAPSTPPFTLNTGYSGAFRDAGRGTLSGGYRVGNDTHVAHLYAGGSALQPLQPACRLLPETCPVFLFLVAARFG